MRSKRDGPRGGAEFLRQRTGAGRIGAVDVDGQLGRNLDEPDLWVLSTRWESVGAYRRALSEQGRGLEVTEVSAPDLAPIIQSGFPFKSKQNRPTPPKRA